MTIEEAVAQMRADVTASLREDSAHRSFSDLIFSYFVTTGDRSGAITPEELRQLYLGS